MTNRELIRRKFKFEEFKLGDKVKNYASISDDEDDIIQGSNVFNSQFAPI